ncbi:predicted protein [Coccidioides posadasii C735 delta SOWgp]|uniref:PPM-type phosphatase domain-containing protein n=1 Tax=Coccidioides posadasii (strain C735) TaxID=222929 RepID=C5P2L3_COCP7|nr:predicted protein [Coccidioides posadasii C735 delta SOWgp]EER28844.1 predicted protein [Coccidioides posadasii C735 delta SOWgp]|eukprot:XP_003070989.1 predicted protein [Coccidioides posadasii C735 delta SOWgp]
MQDQGQRPRQEDRYAFITPQGFPACDHRQFAFFAVYDGQPFPNGGPNISDHASEHLHLNLISSPAFQAGDCENAIRGAIDAEENQLIEGFASSGNDASTSGSTVALALVDLNKGEVVITNLGDSHIVLGELEWTGGKLTYKVKRLTTADNPDVLEEKSRVEAAGTIKMSRALRVLQYKKPLNDEDAARDFISSQPHICLLKPNPDILSVLIIATHDVRTVDEHTLVEFIGQQMEEGHDAGSICEKYYTKMCIKKTSR